MKFASPLYAFDIFCISLTAPIIVPNVAFSYNLTFFSGNPIYRDTRDSRRKLWKRIKAEVNAGRINVDNMDKVRDAIINDSPSNANQYIKYGVILTKTMND